LRSGSHNPALGCALTVSGDFLAAFVIFVDHRCLKPQTNQLQHRSVHNPHSQTFHQFVMRNRVKIPFQISIINGPQSLFDVLSHLAESFMGRTLGSKPIRAIHKIRLKDGFNDQQHRRLDHPVPNRRYAQRALPAIGFGYPHPTNHRRPVRFGSQALLDIIQKPLNSTGTALDIFEGNAVNTGFAFVRPGNLIRTAQHITPIDPIIQHVKPKLRLQLRLPVKLLSQRGEFRRQLDLLYMGTLPHIDRSPDCQLFRSRTFVQAAHSFSDSACSQQGPLAPRALPRFFATMDLSDSQSQQISRLCIPGHPLALTPSRAGSPRFLGASFRTRPPQTPRNALQVPTPVATLQVAGFVHYGRLATLSWTNEAESGSLALGLARSRSVVLTTSQSGSTPDYRSAPHDRLPSHRGPPLHGEQAITMTDTFSQQDTPGLSWRTVKSPI